MKKYFPYIIFFTVILFSAYFLIANINQSQKSEMLSQDELFTAIDSEVNNGFMSVDEYVRNTLKIYLKNKEYAYVSQLSSDGLSGDVIQSSAFYEQFAYGIGIEEENESYHSDDGLGYYDKYKYKFLAEAEGFYAIPLYIMLEGNQSNKEFQYEATSVSDQLPLDLWEIYTEIPVYDRETNLTKWLAVFKYPFGQHLPYKMEVSLMLNQVE
ncbi:hypothetical protein [Enterococcus sp.]|uniref:hypothetical protein n=1 Tax=Enterococcus sp. TaxID=35783 RepID=UPI002899810C|nr:hypothetical protein [Enterococcus sp.]